MPRHDVAVEIFAAGDGINYPRKVNLRNTHTAGHGTFAATMRETTPSSISRRAEGAVTGGATCKR